MDVLKLFADGGISLYFDRTLSSQLAVMAFVRTNWAQFLKSDSELPTDVVFRVEERNEREETNVEKVFAHKLLLAGASPVFRKQFFGALKEATDEVLVQDTTIEAFTTMIHFMYMAPEETEKFALKIPNCAQSLCELVNISERYQILELNKMAKLSLENFLVTEENLIFTATNAKNYSVFEDVSSMLTEKCLYFLMTSLTSAKDVFSLIVKTREAFPDADMDILFSLIKMLNGIKVALTIDTLLISCLQVQMWRLGGRINSPRRRRSSWEASRQSCSPLSRNSPQSGGWGSSSSPPSTAGPATGLVSRCRTS